MDRLVEELVASHRRVAADGVVAGELSGQLEAMVRLMTGHLRSEEEVVLPMLEANLDEAEAYALYERMEQALFEGAVVRLVDCRDLMAPWSSLRVGSALKSVLPGEARTETTMRAPPWVAAVSAAMSLNPIAAIISASRVPGSASSGSSAMLARIESTPRRSAERGASRRALGIWLAVLDPDPQRLTPHLGFNGHARHALKAFTEIATS
jgi:hypothetical protein